ncbi:MAG: alanyl-tRNA editing protein [Phototrophicaceae bacterium]
MTHKVFWENPYLTEFQTQVASVNGSVITLADTIIYAFAGGQESDKGYINDYPVLKAEKDETEIFYTLENNHKLSAGDEVSISIDWKRRYKLMRLHFAAELILELAYQNLEGIEKIGAHIAEDKSRIDFLWDENIKPYLPMLEEKARMLIEENHAIISEFSDIENERRYWLIDGFTQVACGGTHLKNTSEVGKIKLKRNNIGKGKERIEIYLLD